MVENTFSLVPFSDARRLSTPKQHLKPNKSYGRVSLCLITFLGGSFPFGFQTPPQQNSSVENTFSLVPLEDFSTHGVVCSLSNSCSSYMLVYTGDYICQVVK